MSTAIAYLLYFITHSGAACRYSGRCDRYKVPQRLVAYQLRPTVSILKMADTDITKGS